MREFLLNNFLWKLTALMLAVIVWLSMQDEAPQTQTQSIATRINPSAAISTRDIVSHPITIRKPATDTREYRLEPLMVSLTLSGDLEKLKALQGRDVEASVDLSLVRTGSSPTNLTVKVTLPGTGITLDKVQPETIRVEVTKESTPTNPP